MKHLDLFSGIGGFALATEMVWEDVEHIFCDNDPFSQAILKKHWPNSLIYGDIRELNKQRIYDDSLLAHSVGFQPPWDSIDLITGGFPCQPFSAAGRRRGTEDDRHLWPEMLRVIREFRPKFVLGENVGGFLTWEGGLVFEQVCTDLEAEGYEVCPIVIPACAVEAPHRRDRVWIAAHAIGSDAIRTSRQIPGAEGEARIQERNEMGKPGFPDRTRILSDSEHARQHGSEDRESSITGGDHNQTWKDKDEQSEGSALPRNDADTKDTKRIGRGRRSHGDTSRDDWKVQASGHSASYDGWSEDWPTVAARLCTLDDGLPDGLARPKGWRNAALKGAGNAIVPQVAAEIMKALKEPLGEGVNQEKK